LEQLRNIIREDKNFVLEPLEDLVARYSLSMIGSELELPRDFKLQSPVSDSWDGNMDRENAASILELLPSLSRANATDERFWVTLAFREALEYSVLRWGGDKGDNKIILNHWFAPSSRSKWRDHSVARLWFVSSFASSLEGISHENALDVLYSNSELLNSFLGRPRTTASTRVASKLLGLLHEHQDESANFNFDRVKFRALMKEIDLRSGLVMVNALEDPEFNHFFNEIFERIYLA
jgi:hypothetical protein